MYACDYLENGVLNALRAVTFAAPANCYLALYLNDPGENGLGGTEVSYTGYRRMKIDFSAPADSNSGLGIQNVADIAFPTPISAAGTITHIGVLDSLAGGNMLARDELVEPLVIGANEPPVFLAGDVLFYLTGNLSKAWKTKVLNVFRGTSIQGVTPYFSPWNGSPETSGSELSGDNYQRVSITFGAPAEQASGQIVARNSATAAFPRPSTLWGTWTYSVLYSAEISGEPVVIKPLTSSDGGGTTTDTGESGINVTYDYSYTEESGGHSHKFRYARARQHRITIPSHNHRVELPSHSHTFSIPRHDYDVRIPSHTHEVTLYDHRHEANIPNHKHEVTIPNHKHKVTIPNHRHELTIPNHTHDVTIKDHTYTLTIPGHSRRVTVPSHAHNITPGIYQFGNPQKFSLYINRAKKADFSGTTAEMDISIDLIIQGVHTVPGGLCGFMEKLFMCTQIYPPIAPSP